MALTSPRTLSTPVPPAAERACLDTLVGFSPLFLLHADEVTKELLRGLASNEEGREERGLAADQTLAALQALASCLQDVLRQTVSQVCTSP